MVVRCFNWIGDLFAEIKYYWPVDFQISNERLVFRVVFRIYSNNKLWLWSEFLRNRANVQNIRRIMGRRWDAYLLPICVTWPCHDDGWMADDEWIINSAELHPQSKYNVCNNNKNNIRNTKNINQCNITSSQFNTHSFH